MKTDLINAQEYLNQLDESVAYLKKEGRAPKIAIVLGSGLGGFADTLDDRLILPYGSIPHFPVSGVPGHAGNLVLGRLGGIEIAAFQGRVHCYEGYSSARVAFGIRAMALLGMQMLIVTNAAGGLNPKFKPGDFMLIENHLSFFVEDPLHGLQHPRLEPKFYDQTHPYSEAVNARLETAARELKIRTHRGVYIMLQGPRYESAAEIQTLRMLGADAVAMSAVPEVLAARHLGVRHIAGISLITNLAAGISPSALNHQEVTDAAEAAKPNFIGLITHVLSQSHDLVQ